MKKSSSLCWLLTSQYDDAKVVFEGKIKSHIKSDKYEFVDKNGDVIVVEIDNKKWGNVTANEDTPLRIRGEVDKDFNKNRNRRR